MSTNKKCSQCGAELPASAPGGHCLKCLLELGLTVREAGSSLATAAKAITVVEKPGDVIGRYKLLQQIGEGGCGVVYMAEQVEPVRRQVALKVIKLGMDTKQVIIRFEAERQALALMDHPNIAKVLDAGVTETGRPYFVMELVRGIKITDYCNEQKFSTRRRLDLFILVCQAIQHAHQKGIIHRDIKPSNILVTEQDGAAVPKIIDFGIAKATTDQRLTDKTFFTAFEQFLGTPAYMSPEQAGLGGLDIDTRSDIYSLGVLLYELLTGQPPFNPEELRGAALVEILRTIRDKDPPRPSARLTTLTEQELSLAAECHQTEPAKFSRQLDGDLDWVVMKTLEKDRARRYETASGLAADLQRHLNNEPVAARPPSAWYRFQKLVRRNKFAVAAAGSVLSALIIGLCFSTWFFLKERQSHRRADEQAQRALIAEKDVREQLWNSRLTQARAERASHSAGRRLDSLELLTKAAEYRPSLALRNEAIAALALTDLHLAQRLTNDWAGSALSAFDGSFERVAIGDQNGNVSVRDRQSGFELMSLPGIGSPAHEFLFSPDSRRLAVIYGTYLINKHALLVWDLATQRVIGLEPGVTNCRTLCFSPDSSKLVVAQFPPVVGETPLPILLYDLKSGREIKSFPITSLPWGIVLDPFVQTLAISSAEGTDVLLRDVATGRLLWTLPHPAGVRELAWNASGDCLATACADGKIYLWDVATGKRSRVLSGHQSALVGINFNHVGDLLASTGWDGRLRLWNITTGLEICNWPFEREQYLVTFSPDDHWLSLFSGTKQTRFEVVGNDETNVLKCISTGDQEIWGATYSADGRVLASIHRDGLRFWDARTSAQIGFRAMQDVGSAVFDRQGKFLFTGNSQGVEQWPIHVSMGTGTDQLTLGPAETVSHRPEQGRFCRPFNRAATMAALVSDGKVCLVDLATRCEKGVLAGAIPFENAAVSDNGRWCAATSYADALVTVFDFSNSIPVKVLPVATQFKTVAFSPDNHWLVTGDIERYQFWDTANWQCRFSVRRAATAATSGQVAFSTDGQMAAVAASSDLIQLVDLPSGAELATLESSAPQTVNCMEFSPDGGQLAVNGIGYAHYLQLWDLRLLREKLAAMNLDW